MDLSDVSFGGQRNKHVALRSEILMRRLRMQRCGGLVREQSIGCIYAVGRETDTEHRQVRDKLLEARENTHNTSLGRF
jgi:hypothetical protein